MEFPDGLDMESKKNTQRMTPGFDLISRKDRVPLMRWVRMHADQSWRVDEDPNFKFNFQEEELN